MRSLIKLDRAMQIKRIEGKAALEQCLLAKQTLKYSCKRYVQDHPWTTLGMSALLAITVTKLGKSSRIKSSISSISLLLNGALNLNQQLSTSATSSAALSSETKAERPNDAPAFKNSMT